MRPLDGTARAWSGAAVAPVIVVSGTLRMRAQQFAHALERVPRALEMATTNVVRTSVGHAKTSTPASLADVIERQFARALWDRGTEFCPGFEAAQRQFGVTLGEKFDSDPARHAVAALAPDVIGLLQAAPGQFRAPAGPLGCTSLALLPPATRSGSLLFGRAHDVVGACPSETRAVLHIPAQGWAHLSLHTAGAFHPGFSAVNEHGLCVGVHPVTTGSVSRDGVPLAAIATRLIEQATSLDDAIALLTSVHAATGAAFALAHGARAAVVEVDGDGPGAVLFPPRIHLAVGAPFRTRKNVAAFCSSELLREQSWARLSRLNALARAHTRHTPQTVATALGDDGDAYVPTRHRAFGNTVYDLFQVGAFVVDTGARAIFVADGSARAVRWKEMSLDTLFGQTATLRRTFAAWSDDDDTTLPLHVRTSAIVHEGFTVWGRAADRPAEQARRLHADAARGALLDGAAGLAAAEKLLADANALDRTEPLHALALAIVRLQRATAPESIAPLCAHVLAHEVSPYRRGLAGEIAARAAFVRGDRLDAARWKAEALDAISRAHPALQRRIRRLNAFGARRKGAYVPAYADYFV